MLRELSTAAAATTQGAPDAFEMPPGTSPEDALVLEHLLVALQSLEGPHCMQYKVEPVEGRGFMVHAKLPKTDPFELSLDDMLFLRSVHPARVERIAVGRQAAGGGCELLLLVLDSRQKVMVSSTVAFFSAARKRKFEAVAPA